MATTTTSSLQGAAAQDPTIMESEASQKAGNTSAARPGLAILGKRPIADQLRLLGVVLLVLVVALGVLILTLQVGHTGAVAVWGDVIKA